MSVKTLNRTRVGICLPTPLLEWVDTNKDFATRSHFIATGLDWYRRFLEGEGKTGNNENENDSTLLHGASMVGSPERHAAQVQANNLNNQPEKGGYQSC